MARTPFKLRSGNSTPFKQMGSSPSPAKDTNPHTGMAPPHTTEQHAKKSKKKGTDWGAMHEKAGKKDPRYAKMTQEEYKAEALRQSKVHKETGKWDAMGVYDAKGKKKVVTPKKDDTTSKKDDTTVVVKKDDTTVKADTGKETKKVSKYSTREGRITSEKKLKTKQKVAKISATADVKTARAKYGRGSAEVKAAKEAKRTLKKKQKTRRLQGEQRAALAQPTNTFQQKQAKKLAKRIAKRKAKAKAAEAK